MTDIRAKMAKAANSSNLAGSDHGEMPVDCLGAMGMAGRKEALGMLACRLKYGNDASAHAPLAQMLGGFIYLRRLPRPILHGLLNQAIREFVMPLCRHCKGRGIIANVAGVVGTCKACHGSTLRRYSDAERLTNIGVPVQSVKAHRYTEQVTSLVSVLQTECSTAARTTKVHLSDEKQPLAVDNSLACTR